MKLTRRQTKLLKMFNELKNRNPNFKDILFQLASLPLHITLIILIFIFREYFQEFYLFLIGIPMGAMLRDIGFAVRQNELWVVLKEIIKWEKVDVLLKETNE